MNDLDFMRLALAEAEKALAEGDVPIGAVVVWNDQVVGAGFNRREADHDATAHAEIVAIRQASERLGRWRLDDCALYVTLEPCPMCAGAIVLARIPRVIYAAPDPKAGAAGSIVDLLRHPRLNHRVDVQGGLLAGEAAAQLRAFFQTLRDEGQG
ncbi:MAG: tRNA adenosine(34) deaminase TadA [Anaerolineae bacterium]|nr:tRNA adenosine(34) deaminase TadA [Anaerolineae bacterium]